jgi:glucosylceramidase
MNDHVFTYDDVQAGQTDPSLAHFSLAEDEADLIPVLKEVLAIAPGLQILASPWTAPSWMKSNGLPKGGTLKPELYPVYATYLVRYLKAMQAHGVPIAALTMQNEPENPKNTPSMVLTAEEEGAFLRDALGPALKKARLKTKVVLYDHNCNHPNYPMAILSDAKAAAYADGSGFHLYEGEISAMSQVHDAFPKKNLYFTEQMVVEHERNGVQEPIAEPVSRVLLGAMRNWSRNVLLWNLAADPSFGPHTSDGGCPMCQGAITIDGDKVTRNIAFYAVAQVSEFVPPGSVRIDSTQSDPTLANAAWKTPAGKRVLVVTNTGMAKQEFSVASDGKQFAASLEPGSVGTFVW